MFTAFTEGWGLYAEWMMLPYMPAEGQLISLQLRLLRAARAFLDPLAGHKNLTTRTGALVERMSGVTLDEFFRTRIFEPLGMTDTAFAAPEGDVDRCSALYALLPGMEQRMRVAGKTAMTSVPTMLSGGGGLVSSADDYLRFCHLLIGRGQLDGVRLLSPRTLAFMASNHLPGGRTLNEMGQATFSESAMAGTGFGLGFSVLVDQAASANLGTPGMYAWGGAASTAFWVDPVEDITTVFMTQLLPSSTYPIRSQLRQLVYASLVD